MSLLFISSILSLVAMSLPYIKLNISSDDELFNFFQFLIYRRMINVYSS